MISIFKTIFLNILIMGICAHLHSTFLEESITRHDSTQAIAYINTPDNQDSFPIVIYLDGSFKQSVKNNFLFLSHVFNIKHIGVAAIEKRGIAENGIIEDEWLLHDTFQDRLEDNILLIRHLGEKIPGWNGKLIFIGSSEGGKIAPALSLTFTDLTYGTVLIGSGGGLPFEDEIKYQIKQIAISNKPEGEIDFIAMNQRIDHKFAEILGDPFSTKQYYEKSYRWFSYYLQYNLLSDLLKIETPILLIQGVKDTHIPVESADLINDSFNRMGKNNLDYHRIEDLGHSIGNRIDVFFTILNWSSQRLQENCANYQEAI